MNQALTPEQLALHGVGIAHHFGGGVYIKETFIPAGAELGQHAHNHDHLSVLVSGEVILTKTGPMRSTMTPVFAPAVLTVEAGVKHSVRATKDSVWLCVWATDETDPQKVDEQILKG